MNMSAEEFAWLLLDLESVAKKMPGTRSQDPHYDASTWDLDDLFRAFRADAVWSRDIIWKAVSERATSGIWPKMETKHSFWLRQRWLMALRYCRAVLENRRHSDPTAVVANRPKDAEAALKWLWIDLWDTRLVDVWIRENARSCVAVDWPESGEGIEQELERYFRKIGAC